MVGTRNCCHNATACRAEDLRYGRERMDVAEDGRAAPFMCGWHPWFCVGDVADEAQGAGGVYRG